jgi:hypothetical protein
MIETPKVKRAIVADIGRFLIPENANAFLGMVNINSGRAAKWKRN